MRQTSLQLCLFVWLALSLTSSQTLAVEPGDETPTQHVIIGGSPEQTPYPWTAALIRRGAGTVTSRQFCGGVLIAPTWVLTAAHCLRAAEAGDYQVLIGELNLETASPAFHDVAEHIPHPFFVDNVNRFDLALIRLATPSANGVITLADAEVEQQAMDSSYLYVQGWGNVAWNSQADCTMHFLDSVVNAADFTCKTFVYRPGTDTSTLKTGMVTLQSYADCDRRYKAALDSQQIPYDDAPAFSASDSPGVLCAWAGNESTSPCFGDSGGPLLGNFNVTNYVIGITSFGVLSDCATSQQVGVYTRVAYFRDFIEHTMAGTLELGHARLCPGSLAPTLTYTPHADGRQDARLAWQQDPVAEGYRVFYSPHQSLGGNVQHLELGGGANHISVALASGQKFFVAVQARSARCDGPLSALVMVDVP